MYTTSRIVTATLATAVCVLGGVGFASAGAAPAVTPAPGHSPPPRCTTESNVSFPGPAASLDGVAAGGPTVGCVSIPSVTVGPGGVDAAGLPLLIAR